jgi:tRNA 2-thiocytidine biosynthesis protein TtcA
LPPGLLAPLPEKSREDGTALGLENSARHRDTVIELRLSDHVEQAACGSGLGIARTIDQAGDSRQDHCSSAHGAGFERDVEAGAGQPPGPGCPASLAQGQNLGVRGRVPAAFALVAGAPDDLATDDHQGRHRRLTPAGGTHGEREGTAHPDLVRHGSLGYPLAAPDATCYSGGVDPELQRLERKLLGDVGRAVGDFELVAGGDRILVALSGGKDSYTLLQLLRRLQERAPVRFSLLAVNLDQGHPGFPAARLEDWLRAQGYDYRMLAEDTYSVVTEKVPEGKTYCGLCSRLRRGILYNAAEALGCNKIALGHHRDDLIETLMLNLFFSGKLSSMPPKLHSDDGRNIVIRPLCYAAEADIARYAELCAFPILPCDLCGSQENLQRKRVKVLLDRLSTEHPHLRESIAAAIGNVKPSHLMDRRLLDGAAPVAAAPVRLAVLD